MEAMEHVVIAVEEWKAREKKKTSFASRQKGTRSDATRE